MFVCVCVRAYVLAFVRAFAPHSGCSVLLPAVQGLHVACEAHVQTDSIKL